MSPLYFPTVHFAPHVIGTSQDKVVVIWEMPEEYGEWREGWGSDSDSLPLSLPPSILSCKFSLGLVFGREVLWELERPPPPTDSPVLSALGGVKLFRVNRHKHAQKHAHQRMMQRLGIVRWMLIRLFGGICNVMITCLMNAEHTSLLPSHVSLLVKTQNVWSFTRCLGKRRWEIGGVWR